MSICVVRCRTCGEDVAPASCVHGYRELDWDSAYWFQDQARLSRLSNKVAGDCSSPRSEGYREPKHAGARSRRRPGPFRRADAGRTARVSCNHLRNQFRLCWLPVVANGRPWRRQPGVPAIPGPDQRQGHPMHGQAVGGGEVGHDVGLPLRRSSSASRAHSTGMWGLRVKILAALGRLVPTRTIISSPSWTAPRLMRSMASRRARRATRSSSSSQAAARANQSCSFE